MSRVPAAGGRAELVKIAIVCVLSICATECAARQIPAVWEDWQAGSDAYAGQAWAQDWWRAYRQAPYEWTSYLYWKHAPYHSQYINIDQAGRRQTSDTAASADGPRIFMFGGSTLWGVGARDDYTIPSLLARLVRDAGCTNVHVVNYGEDGYVTTQEVSSLVLALEAGERPAYVVFYDGINDTMSALQNGRAGIPVNEAKRKAEFDFGSGQWIPSVFLRQFALYRYAEKLSGRLSALAPLPPVSHQVALDEVSIYNANMDLVGRLGAQYGFKTLYVWQPVIYSKQQRSAWEQNEIRKIDVRFQAWFDDVYAALHGSDIARSSSNFIDLARIFDTTPQTVFLDTWHISEAGNSVIAHSIAGALAPSLACTRG